MRISTNDNTANLFECIRSNFIRMNSDSSFHSLANRFAPILKQYWLPILLGFFGLILFVYGLIGLFGTSAKQDDIVFESSSQADSKVQTQIVVDVEGAVESPGVYHVNSESRVQDAVIAAGGLSAQADREWVEKNINLAAKLKDGVKIYIPPLRQGFVGQASTLGEMSSNLININTASQGELESLPGIGPVTAQKIIEGRQYGSIEDLLDKKIVKSSVFEKIKEKISAY